MKILIVDDHPIYLEGLRNLLVSWGYTDIVVASSGQESLMVAVEAEPQLVLLDIGLPDIDGIEVCKRLRALRPTLAVVMLTSVGDEDTFFRSIQAGATGYLMKTLDGPDLRRCLSDLEAGRTPFSPGLESALLRRVRQTLEPGSGDGASARLTLRQKEVLRAQAQGKTYKEIGEALFISERTVKFHVEQVKRLLGLQTKRELIDFSERYLN